MPLFSILFHFKFQFYPFADTKNLLDISLQSVIWSDGNATSSCTLTLERIETKPFEWTMFISFKFLSRNLRSNDVNSCHRYIHEIKIGFVRGLAPLFWRCMNCDEARANKFCLNENECETRTQQSNTLIKNEIENIFRGLNGVETVATFNHKFYACDSIQHCCANFRLT